jgi:hypothetical protein
MCYRMNVVGPLVRYFGADAMDPLIQTSRKPLRAEDVSETPIVLMGEGA